MLWNRYIWLYRRRIIVIQNEMANALFCISLHHPIYSFQIPLSTSRIIATIASARPILSTLACCSPTRLKGGYVPFLICKRMVMNWVSSILINRDANMILISYCDIVFVVQSNFWWWWTYCEPICSMTSINVVKIAIIVF